MKRGILSYAGKVSDFRRYLMFMRTLLIWDRPEARYVH